MASFDYEDTEYNGSSSVFYLESPPFTHDIDSPDLPRDATLFPVPKMKEIKIEKDLCLDDFEIMRKKSKDGETNHLLFVGFRGKIPTSIKKWFSGKDLYIRNRFKKHVPLMEPKDYTTSNHATRKYELLQRFLYIISFDEKTFDNYIYLVERLRLYSTLGNMLDIVCENEKIYRIPQIQRRFKAMGNIAKADKLMNSEGAEKTAIPNLDGDRYSRFMLYLYMHYCAGGNNYVIMNDEFISPVTIQLFSHPIIWLLHVAHPELDQCYKKFFCDPLAVEYVPSYVMHGESFAKFIEDIILHGEAMLNEKCNFLLNSNGLNKHLFWKHKSRPMDSYTDDEMNDILKIVTVLKRDKFFQTVVLFSDIRKEINLISSGDVLKDAKLNKLKKEVASVNTLEKKCEIMKRNKSEFVSRMETHKHNNNQ